MTKWKGFALIKLNRATTDNDQFTHSYHVTIHSKHGMVEDFEMKETKMKNDWGKRRMKDKRYARMDGSDVSFLTEDQYNEAVIKWTEAQ